MNAQHIKTLNERQQLWDVNGSLYVLSRIRPELIYISGYEVMAFRGDADGNILDFMDVWCERGDGDFPSFEDVARSMADDEDFAP